MYFNFDDMKWHFPIFSSSWSDVTAELDEISAWAWIPVQPSEWIEDEDMEFEDQMNQLDIWQIQKMDRQDKLTELKKTYGHPQDES